MESPTVTPKRALVVIYTRGHHEVLMHKRGKFYGLPTVTFDNEHPTRDDIERAINKTAMVSPPFENTKFRILLEFDEKWDGAGTHFVLCEVVNTNVLARLGESILVPIDFPRIAGEPDFSVMKLRALIMDGRSIHAAA